MAFMWDQRQRLLREQWTAPQLSEELFAMMSPDMPSSTQGPVQVALPPGSTVAPFQIGNVQDGQQLFSFTHPDGTPFGGISIVGGSLVITGQTETPGGGGGGGGSSVPRWQ